MEVEGSLGQFVSFMDQLRVLCHHLDKEVTQLKEEIIQPPGQKPHHYDAAMRKIQKDVEELKNSSADAKSKLVSMENFSSFLVTTTELVDEQEKSISKMEEYLQKFAYKPLDISSEPNDVKVEDIENSPCETNPEVSSQKPAGKFSSPVLSEVGRSVIQGNDITQDLSNIVNKKTNVSLKETHKFEISSSEVESGLGNPKEENLTNDLVTNQYSGRPLPFPVKDESSIMDDQKKIMDDLTEGRIMGKDHMSLPTIKIENPSTPVTPEFSEATMSFFKLIPKKENIDHNDTIIPDEPSLYYEETKKQFGSLNDTVIPEEPVLSNMYGKMQLVDTPEEPTLLASRKRDDTPETPVFSEATKSLFRYMPPTNTSNELVVKMKMDKSPEASHFSNAMTAHSNLVSLKDYVGHSEVITPEEPSFNYDYSRKYPYPHKNTPEEPTLSSACAVKDTFVASSNIDDDMPPSPELSSYTQSFLKSQTKVREIQHSDMRRTLYDLNKYESMIDKEYSNENVNRSHQTNQLEHMYSAHIQNEYLDQENDDYTSFVNNSSHMNKSAGGSNFSFITPAKERGNVNRSYSLAMERIANQNDSPDSPQLSDISMSIVNRSQRW